MKDNKSILKKELDKYLLERLRVVKMGNGWALEVIGLSYQLPKDVKINSKETRNIES